MSIAEHEALIAKRVFDRQREIVEDGEFGEEVLLDLPFDPICQVVSSSSSSRSPLFPSLPLDQERDLYPHFKSVLNQYIQQHQPGSNTISAEILQAVRRSDDSRSPDLVITSGASEPIHPTKVIPAIADVQIKLSFHAQDSQTIDSNEVLEALAQCLRVSLRRRNSLREQQVEFDSFPHFFLLGDGHGHIFPFKVIVSNKETEMQFKQLSLYMTSPQALPTSTIFDCIYEWGSSLQPDFDAWFKDAVAESGKVTTQVRYQLPTSFTQVQTEPATLLQVEEQGGVDLFQDLLVLSPVPDQHILTKELLPRLAFPPLEATPPPIVSSAAEGSLEQSLLCALQSSFASLQSCPDVGPLHSTLQPVGLRLLPTGVRSEDSYLGTAFTESNDSVLVSAFFSESALLNQLHHDARRVSSLLSSRPQVGQLVQVPCEWRVVGGFNVIPAPNVPKLHEPAQMRAGVYLRRLGGKDQGNLQTLTQLALVRRPNLWSYVGDKMCEYPAVLEVLEDDDPRLFRLADNLLNPRNTIEVLAGMVRVLQVLHGAGLTYGSVNPDSLLFDEANLSKVPILAQWSSLSLAAEQAATSSPRPLNLWAQLFSAEQAWVSGEGSVSHGTASYEAPSAARAMLGDLESAVYTALFLTRTLPWEYENSAESVLERKRAFWEQVGQSRGRYAVTKSCLALTREYFPSGNEEEDAIGSGFTIPSTPQEKRVYKVVSKMACSLSKVHSKVCGSEAGAAAVSASLKGGKLHSQWLKWLEAVGQKLSA
eukprot:GILI01005889.1.p1 GENE.GILI01005889.1~~GILI01005889.1.p1  ORF type:complete len:849 (+),score=188.02 GILI01005889.1:262-2547(+)